MPNEDGGGRVELPTPPPQCTMKMEGGGNLSFRPTPPHPQHGRRRKFRCQDFVFQRWGADGGYPLCCTDACEARSKRKHHEKHYEHLSKNTDNVIMLVIMFSHNVSAEHDLELEHRSHNVS